MNKNRILKRLYIVYPSKVYVCVCVCLCTYMFLRPCLGREKHFLWKEIVAGLVCSLAPGLGSQAFSFGLPEDCPVGGLPSWFWISDLSSQALILHDASRRHSPSTPNCFLVVHWNRSLLGFGTRINFRRRWRKSVWNWEPKYVDFPWGGDWSEHLLSTVRLQQQLGGGGGEAFWAHGNHYCPLTFLPSLLLPDQLFFNNNLRWKLVT